MSTWRKQYEDLVAQITDTRVYEQDGVAAVLLFGFHLVDFLATRKVTYRGHNIKNQGWCYLLIVKVAIEGIPLVVFISERDPTVCMRIFIRQFEEDRVEWREDKFA